MWWWLRMIIALLIMCTFICRPDWSFIKGETYPVSGPYLRMPCIMGGSREKLANHWCGDRRGWGKRVSGSSPSFYKWEEDWDPEREGTFPLVTRGYGWIHITPQLLPMQTSQIPWSPVEQEAPGGRLSLKAHAPGEPASPLLPCFHWQSLWVLHFHFFRD